MEKLRKINFLNNLIVKENFENTFRWSLFLTVGAGLSILKSIMSNEIVTLSIERVLASLYRSLRIAVVRFKFFSSGTKAIL